MSTVQSVLQEFREKRRIAQIEIEKLNQIISGIESLNGVCTRGLPRVLRDIEPCRSRYPHPKMISTSHPKRRQGRVRETAVARESIAPYLTVYR